ncbi:MAG TPA: hypothetical protein VMU54_25535 [Planctomycetota bacterium]|nr:hypothetical protein [Planctomycetota bacterium]
MGTELKDPVCGAAVDSVSAIHEKSGDRDYMFCSDECRIRFIVNPGRYLSKT